MGLPFISLTDLSNQLGRDVTSDLGAEFAIEAACDIVRDVTDQTFTQTLGDVINLDGSGTDTLLLPERPVTNVAGTILVNGDPETYFLCTTEGLLFRGTSSGWSGDGIGVGFGSYMAVNGFSWADPPRPTWPKGRQNIQVTYDHGYAGVEDMPQSLRLVALSIAARTIVQGQAISESVGNGVNVRYAISPGALDSNELRILQKYRRPASS